jgi:hypothetical protein
MCVSVVDYETVSTPASHSGGPGFETRPRDRLALQVFVIIVYTFRQKLGQHFKAGHYRFVPHLLSSSFTYTVIQRCITSVIEKASLNRRRRRHGPQLGLEIIKDSIKFFNFCQCKQMNNNNYQYPTIDYNKILLKH